MKSGGVWLCEHHVDQWSLLRFFPRGRGVNFPGERLTDEEGEWAVAFIQRMSSENPGSAVFMIQVMAASMCIQMARAAQKNNCPVWLKRSFRIGGFVLSPVMALWPAATLSVCLLVSACVLLARSAVDRGAPRGAAVVPVMVFHQMHYFVYTYIMPVWFFALSGSLIWSGLMFGLTWVIYLLPQTVAERVGSVEPRKMFLVCHAFLALVMGTLCVASVLNSAPLICTAWLLSGLGGGSVFCIKELSPDCQRTDLTLSENIGHVAGVGVSLSNLSPEDNRWLEPGAGTAQERLEALRILHENGISTFLFIAPYLPGLTELESLAGAVKLNPGFAPETVCALLAEADVQYVSLLDSIREDLPSEYGLHPGTTSYFGGK